MAVADYDVKNDQATVETTGPIETISHRLALTVADPVDVAGTADMLSKIVVRLSNAKSGKIEEVSDLKLQIFVNNTPFGSERDFSTGKFTEDVPLEAGRNRVTAQIVGYGLHATVTILLAKIAGEKSILPTKADSYVTGLDSIRTQVTPEKAGVQITYTRDDSSWTCDAETDARGMAHCSGIVIKRPTFFTIVAPVTGITQIPERLCIVPPPVGIPKWPKIVFLCSALTFCLALALMILTLFASSGGSTPKVVKLPSDPIERMRATAQNNYKGYDAPDPVQKQSFVPAIRSMLWKAMLYAFLVSWLSGIACVFNACVAVGRNWKYRHMEDRTGTIPRPTAPQQAQPAVQTPPQPGQQKPAASGWNQQAWAIIREIIAEMSVDAAARSIRAFKMPRITIA